MIRIIVAFDVDTDKLDEAYAEVMDGLTFTSRPMRFGKPFCQWETTDEWFPPDADEPGSEVEFRAMAAKYWESKRRQV